MLPEEVPACRCGARSWAPGGAYVGGAMSQESFRCTACDDRMMVIHHGGGTLAVATPADERLQQPVIDYVNAVCMPVWRTMADKRDAWRGVYRADALRHVNVELGLPPEAKGSDVPDALFARWSGMLDAIELRARGAMPPELRDDPLPPRMPDDMFAYVRRDGDWRRVWPPETRDLPVPPDPIRVRHDALYAGAFARVEAACGVTLDRREVPNRYYDDAQNNEPWYAFAVGEVRFVVGPRKRVHAIQASCDRPFDVAALRAAARADGVTYEADDAYFGERTDARHVEVHAWGVDKLVAYLTLLVAAAQTLGHAS